MKTEESLPPRAQEPFRWGILDLIVFSVFFVLVLIILPLSVALFLQVFQPDRTFEDLSGVELISIQAAMNVLVVGFIVILVRRLHGQPILQTLRWVPQQRFPLGFLLASGAFMAFTGLIVTFFFPEPVESPLERLLTTTPSIVAFVIFGIVVAPFLEEVVFRGFLFPVLTDIVGLTAAIPLTALLFAALHGSQLWGNWPALAMIFVVGYVLTIIRQRSNSLIPSVIMHTTYNATIFVLNGLAILMGENSIR